MSLNRPVAPNVRALPAFRSPRWTAEQGSASTGNIILPPIILPFLRSAADYLLCGPVLWATPPGLHAQHRFTRLHSFGATNLAQFAPLPLMDGREPRAALVLESNGLFMT